ncbi:hypothetical protein [Psychroserpens algicola]|uniref:Lipocalin-like domain-containing protein n=1 Tax=Psychroserpens algicola TaxID=1719034 RepID=A0ABT0HDL6_9FLAO|nr:hypothetical protein [Psychroserpens algicola]MCK8482154.1 hypothetical protein [Psychroserpens algicola]
MKFKLLALALVVFTFMSCGSDDSSDDSPSGGTESFIVIKNGVTFEGENINNTLIITSQGDQGARRLDLRCDIDGGTFILSISNWEFQNPPADGVVVKSYNTNTEMGPDTDCESINGTTYCDEALVTFLIGQEVFISELNDLEDIGDITITSNDASNLEVSGTFDVLLRNFNSQDEEYMTYTGTFTNVSYSVFQ